MHFLYVFILQFLCNSTCFERPFRSSSGVHDLLYSALYVISFYFPSSLHTPSISWSLTWTSSWCLLSGTNCGHWVMWNIWCINPKNVGINNTIIIHNVKLLFVYLQKTFIENFLTPKCESLWTDTGIYTKQLSLNWQHYAVAVQLTTAICCFGITICEKCGHCNTDLSTGLFPCAVWWCSILLLFVTFRWYLVCKK
jgi:hypothetical protein